MKCIQVLLLRGVVLSWICLLLTGCSLLGDSNSEEEALIEHGSVLLQTTDNGISWSNKRKPFVNTFDLVSLPPNGKLYATGVSDNHYRFASEATLDPTAVWQDEPSTNASLDGSLDDLEIQAPSRLWIADGHLFLFENNHWIMKSSPLAFIQSIKFLWANPQYGLSKGVNPANGRSAIALTTDGGENWVVQDFNAEILSMALVNDSTYLYSLKTVADENGTYRTTDYGQTWERVSYTALSAMEFEPNTPYGFGSGNDVLYRTTDYGETWSQFQIATSNPEASGYSFPKITSGGDGVWFIAEWNNFYNEITHKVVRYEYFIRRLSGNGNSSTSVPLPDITGPDLYNFSFISVNRQNPNQAYVGINY